MLLDHQGDVLHRRGCHHRDQQASPGPLMAAPMPSLSSVSHLLPSSRPSALLGHVLPAPSPPLLSTPPPLQLLCPALAASRVGGSSCNSLVWAFRHKPSLPCFLLVRGGGLELPQRLQLLPGEPGKKRPGWGVVGCTKATGKLAHRQTGSRRTCSGSVWLWRHPWAPLSYFLTWFGWLLHTHV